MCSSLSVINIYIYTYVCLMHVKYTFFNDFVISVYVNFKNVQISHAT